MAQLNKYAKRPQTGPGITNEMETTGAESKPRANSNDLSSGNSELKEPISDRNRGRSHRHGQATPQVPNAAKAGRHINKKRTSVRIDGASEKNMDEEDYDD